MGKIRYLAVIGEDPAALARFRAGEAFAHPFDPDAAAKRSAEVSGKA